MLTVENLSKTYANGVQALRGVSLSVPPGLFGLLGPNGAGKSSLMRTLATLQQADSGSARLNGLDLLRDKHQVRRVLGYLPQEFGLYPRVDPLTLLSHLASLKGIQDRGERRRVVESLLRLTNLWDVRNQKLGTFSGGMKQRFGIAQALLGDPQLIIVDEPTTGLDPEERRRFLNLLARIGERAVIILSTHLVADVLELCGAMAVINKGQVLVQGSPSELVSELEGQVWQKQVTEQELSQLMDSREFLSSTLRAGHSVVRMRSAGSPGEGFKPAGAGLEDVYFATLRSQHGETRAMAG